MILIAAALHEQLFDKGESLEIVEHCIVLPVYNILNRILFFRQFPDSSAASSDPGASNLLCGAPHLPHQDLHHEQRPAQESAGAHELKAHLPCSL